MLPPRTMSRSFPTLSVLARDSTCLMSNASMVPRSWLCWRSRYDQGNREIVSRVWPDMLLVLLLCFGLFEQCFVFRVILIGKPAPLERTSHCVLLRSTLTTFSVLTQLLVSMLHCTRNETTCRGRWMPWVRTVPFTIHPML